MTGGKYPDKNAIKMTALDMTQMGNVTAIMARNDKGQARTVTSLILLVNPVDYFRRVLPATRMLTPDFENFGDGLLTICEADERSLTRTKLEHIRFGNRTVGVTRYWQAQTAGNQVDKLLAIPLEVLDAEQIEVNDVIILENETDWLWDNMTFDESEMKDRAGHYQIKQVQPKYDTKPPALYLSLEKLVHPFKDGRDSGGY